MTLFFVVDAALPQELQKLDRNATKSQQRCGLVVLAQGLTPQIPEASVACPLYVPFSMFVVCQSDFWIPPPFLSAIILLRNYCINLKESTLVESRDHS